MTFAEFKKAYMGGYVLVAAGDVPGFYRKGQSMYGNCDSMIVSDWLYIQPDGVYIVYLKER